MIKRKITFGIYAKWISLSLVFFIAQLVSAQKHCIGFPFIDKKTPDLGECEFCNLKQADLEKLIAYEKSWSELSYKESVPIILRSISNENSNELNGRILYDLFFDLYYDFDNYSGEDSLIFNISNYNYTRPLTDDDGIYLLPNEIKGTLFMIDLIDKCLAYSSSAQTQLMMRSARLEYLSNSTLTSTGTNYEWSIDYVPYDFEFKNEIPERKIWKVYLDDKYSIYKYLSKNDSLRNVNYIDFLKYDFDSRVEINDEINNYTAPIEFLSYRYIAPRVGYVLGKDQWINSELGFGSNYEEDIFRLNFINIAYNYNLKNKHNEFMCSFMDYRGEYLNLKLLNFGKHDNRIGDTKNKFFYRPQVGFHYGIFDVSYEYNLTFKKEIRPNTEKHLINVGVSYPLLRLGKYFKW
jgi:hypothetical protein